MYRAHPNSSQAPHQAKIALYLTHSIIPSVFTKGKEGKKNINNNNTRMRIVSTGLVHFVSHEMSECSILVLSVLNWNKSRRGAFYPACSRATTHVELKLYSCEFTEYPNLVTTDEITWAFFLARTVDRTLVSSTSSLWKTQANKLKASCRIACHSGFFGFRWTINLKFDWLIDVLWDRGSILYPNDTILFLKVLKVGSEFFGLFVWSTLSEIVLATQYPNEGELSYQVSTGIILVQFFLARTLSEGWNSLQAMEDLTAPTWMKTPIWIF